MKISIDIKLPETTEQPKKPTLIERVDYAVDCFLCNHNTEKAYAFIEKVNNRIQSKGPATLTKEDKEILKRIKEIITLHGFKRGTIMNSSHMKDLD